MPCISGGIKTLAQVTFTRQPSASRSLQANHGIVFRFYSYRRTRTFYSHCPWLLCQSYVRRAKGFLNIKMAQQKSSNQRRLPDVTWRQATCATVPSSETQTLIAESNNQTQTGPQNQCAAAASKFADSLRLRREQHTKCGTTLTGDRGQKFPRGGKEARAAKPGRNTEVKEHGATCATWALGTEWAYPALTQGATPGLI